MRVTEHTNFGVVRENINRSKERMEKLQTQAATLKKLNTPSDDPVGSVKVLEIRTDKMNNDQFQMNARLAEAYLENSEQALGELADLVARAKEIAIGQSSGASSNEDTRRGVAEEVQQLYQQSIATANRSIGDRYLFGGFQIDKPPVNGDGKYLGDDGQIMIEIGKNVFVSANIPGSEAFNSSRVAELEESGRSPATTALAMSGYSDHALFKQVNVFDELQNFRIALLAGDLDGVRNTLDRFDEVHSSLISLRSKLGSRIQGLKTMGQAIERHNLINAQLSSNVEDADLAQVMSDLAKEEIVFKNVLHTSQKLIQPTLMDFLK